MDEDIECTKEFIQQGLHTYSDLITWCDSNRKKYEPNTPQYNLWNSRSKQFMNEADILSEKFLHARSEISESSHNEHRIENGDYSR